MAAHYPTWVYSMFAFLGVLATTIPLPWHLEAWNTGTCLYMIWTSLACLNQFINSIVWRNNAINWAPVWCDISTRLIIGSAVAIPAASLCINRRLYYIATANTVTVTRAEKRRAVLVDLAICIGLPVLEMILEYIPQGHRFDIFEEVGCYPEVYMTPLAFVFVSSWPIIIGCVSAVYCTLSIKAFYKRRAQFKELLSSNNNLNSNRYFRLMCLAAIEPLLTLPLGSWGIYLDVQGGVHPWKGWEDTHVGFSRVDQVPSIIWRNVPNLELSLELTRWFIILCAFVFFGFFGFADEARRNYRNYFNSVAKRVGYSTVSGVTSSFDTRKGSGLMSSTGRGVLPVFISKQTSSKRDSLNSFTSASFSGDASISKEKSFGQLSFGNLSIADVGGVLKYKEGAPSTASSSSLSSPTESLPPTYLEKVDKQEAHQDDDDHSIEISSVREPSVIYLTVPALPEPAVHHALRHPIDAPPAAHDGSHDMV